MSVSVYQCYLSLLAWLRLERWANMHHWYLYRIYLLNFAMV